MAPSSFVAVVPSIHPFPLIPIHRAIQQYDYGSWSWSWCCSRRAKQSANSNKRRMPKLSSWSAPTDSFIPSPPLFFPFSFWRTTSQSKVLSSISKFCQSTPDALCVCVCVCMFGGKPQNIFPPPPPQGGCVLLLLPLSQSVSQYHDIWRWFSFLNRGNPTLSMCWVLMHPPT